MGDAGEGIARALAALREDEGDLLDWLVRFVQTASVFDPVAGTTEEPAARLVRELLAGWGWSPLWEEAAPGRPNVVQAIVGELPAGGSAGVGGSGRPARLVEANVDDVTGEVLAHTIAQLLTAGAFDAWATPIVMKKGRPAHTVSALCDDSTFAAVCEVMIAENGTLGIRATSVDRWPQHRTDDKVEVDGHTIRVKIADGRIKVEHDDAAAAAEALGLPLREVLARAEATARERS